VQASLGMARHGSRRKKTCSLTISEEVDISQCKTLRNMFCVTKQPHLILPKARTTTALRILSFSFSKYMIYRPAIARPHNGASRTKAHPRPSANRKEGRERMRCNHFLSGLASMQRYLYLYIIHLLPLLDKQQNLHES
jgi:hypothetical protein